MSTERERREKHELVRAKEDAAIAGIPANILARLAVAQAAFKARGGCPGCGSLILAVHTYPCSECAKHPFD